MRRVSSTASQGMDLFSAIGRSFPLNWRASPVYPQQAPSRDPLL
jgi:hypothetical protein